MAKITTSDFGAIHDALNKMIIGEVKAALRLVPGKRIEGQMITLGDMPPIAGSLCHLVVSPNGDYTPHDLSVKKVWLDEEDKLHFTGQCIPTWLFDRESHFTEDDDLLDISDFHYLIEQLKDMMPDGEHDLTNGADLHNLDRKAHDKLNY